MSSCKSPRPPPPKGELYLAFKCWYLSLSSFLTSCQVVCRSIYWYLRLHPYAPSRQIRVANTTKGGKSASQAHAATRTNLQRRRQQLLCRLDIMCDDTSMSHICGELFHDGPTFNSGVFSERASYEWEIGCSWNVEAFTLQQ